MSILQKNKAKILHIAPKAGFIGVPLLTISLIIVALSYQGGRYDYSFLNHFISELGHTSMSPFYWLFSLGVAIGGPMLTLVLVSLSFKLDSKTGTYAMYVAIISGLACFFVGIFPADILLMPHLVASLVFFFGTLISSGLYALAIYWDKGKNIPMWFVFPSLLVLISGAIFLGLPKEQLAEFLKDREAFDRPTLWWIPFFEWMVLFSLEIWVLLLSFWLKKNE